MNTLEADKLERVVAELIQESNDRFKEWTEEDKTVWVVNTATAYLQTFENASTLLGLKKNQAVEASHVADLLAKLKPAKKHKQA